MQRQIVFQRSAGLIGIQFALRILLAASNVAFALSVFAADAPPPGVEVPFLSTLNLVLVPVSINGAKPLEFIFDTGQEATIVDAQVAGRLGLKILNAQATAVPGGSVMVGSIADSTLAVSGAKAEHLTIQAAPIGFVSSVIGRRISGILGHDFIHRFSVKVDYTRDKITFWSPSAFHYVGHGIEVPVTFEADQTFLPIDVKPHNHAVVTGKFKLDTGSVDTLGMNNNFVRDEHLLGAAEPRIEMPGIAFGGDTKGYLIRLESVRIAGITFHSTLAGYTVDSKGFENRNDAGTVGSAILSRFTLFLDYARNRIIFEPNEAPQTEIPFDRQGVLLRAEDVDLSDVFVYAVIADSSAQRAGVRAGDHIVAVNGVEGLSLGQIWQRFQSSDPLTLKIRRIHKEHTFNIHSAPLLP